MLQDKSDSDLEAIEKILIILLKKLENARNDGKINKKAEIYENDQYGYVISMDNKQKKFISGLYDEFFDNLRLYAEASLHNTSLAEEAVQETFCIACIKIDDLLASSNPRGWLILVLRNVILHIQRNKKEFLRSMSAISFREDAGGYEQAAFYDSQPEFWYKNLTQDKDYELLRKFVIEGYSLKELADEYGLAMSACKQRIRRVKLRFRAIFEKENKKN